MSARHHSRGFLSNLAKFGGSRKKRPLSWPKRIAVGAVLAAFLAIAAWFIVLQGASLLYPSLGASEREGDFPVKEIVENPVGVAPDVVALAKVLVDNREVKVPLTAANREGVATGQKLHLRYTYYPIGSRVEIRDWRLVR